jgi:hypothetical protein
MWLEQQAMPDGAPFWLAASAAGPSPSSDALNSELTAVGWPGQTTVDADKGQNRKRTNNQSAEQQDH